MLVAAAVLPHPPLLIPEVALGAAAELDVLRTACLDALKPVLAAGCDVVVVGASDAGATEVAAGRAAAGVEHFTSAAVGTMDGFGVAVTTRLPGPDGPADPAVRLPLSLTVGAWLMAELGGWGRVRGVSVPPDLSPAEAAALGRQLAASAESVAIVAMGDGASTLSQQAPGYLIEGAQAWQDAVTQALGVADRAAIAAIDPQQAQSYGAAGRAVWQVLAGAATDAGVVSARVLADEAPYGVAYVVAQWTPAQWTPARAAQ